MSECVLSAGEHAAASEQAACAAEGERTGLLIHGVVLTGPMVRTLGEYMMALSSAAIIGTTMEDIAAAGAYGEALAEWEGFDVTVGYETNELLRAVVLRTEEAVAGIPGRLLACCIDFHKSRMAAIAAGFDDSEANRGVAMSWCRAFRHVLALTF